MTDSHQKQIESLTSLLKEAELSLIKVQKDNQSTIVKDAAANDKRHQEDLDSLRKQLENRYDQHLNLMKGQYEAQISQLQAQLSSLHAQSHDGRGGGGHYLNSSSLYNVDAAYSPDGHLLGKSGQSIIPNPGSTAGGEREELEKRIRQAEARSVALSQQLQSMPSSLQVIYMLRLSSILTFASLIKIIFCHPSYTCFSRLLFMLSLPIFPSYNQVAQAEKRVTEARLQKALAASDARVREQIYATVSEELQLSARFSVNMPFLNKYIDTKKHIPYCLIDLSICLLSIIQKIVPLGVR